MTTTTTPTGAAPEADADASQEMARMEGDKALVGNNQIKDADPAKKPVQSVSVPNVCTDTHTHTHTEREREERHECYCNFLFCLRSLGGCKILRFICIFSYSCAKEEGQRTSRLLCFYVSKMV